jgi:hypothetical protein
VQTAGGRPDGNGQKRHSAPEIANAGQRPLRSDRVWVKMVYEVGLAEAVMFQRRIFLHAMAGWLEVRIETVTTGISWELVTERLSHKANYSKVWFERFHD